MIVNRSSRNEGGTSPKSPLTYNPQTGTWEATTPIVVAPTNNEGTGNSSSSTSSSTSPTPSTQKNGGSSPNVDSEKDADKEYIEAEFNILTGEMKLTPTKKSIRIKVNDTVKIEGLGKYLSGLYFVSAVSRNLNESGGYSHTLTLLKNGFGSSVKSSSNQEETRKEEVTKEAPEYKLSDTVRIVGDNAIYSNAHEGVKVPEWVKKKTLTIQQFSDDRTRVLLMPINSWTYVKYIQKV